MHAFLPYVEMKCCNLLFDIDVLYPYLSWMTTFYSVFLVQYINQPFFWPNSCISYVLTYILFFFLFPNSLFFSSALLFPFPISSFSLCVHLPFPCLFPNARSLPCLILFFLVLVFIPCLHSLCSCFCAWTNVPRTNLPQLTALNHDPWPPHHSAGTTLRYGWSVHLRSSSTLLSSCLTLLALLSF